ncbi:MAG: hypothetical protein WC326_00145 [Candidatus Delongbacteria bacterium]
MRNQPERNLSLLAALLLVLLSGTSCERDSDDPAPQPSDSEVFLDGFGPDVTFYAFADSKLDALGIEYSDTYQGSQALRVSVPAEGDPSGWFAGGTLVTQTAGRDLSAYNALTLWVKSSLPATLGVLGLGNDNTGTSRFTTEWAQVSVGTAWQKLVIPIPLAERLTDEKGLFHFAAGHMDGAGYTLWFDEVQFEDLDTITDPRPTIPTLTLQAEAGSSVELPGGSVTFAVDGVDQLLSCLPGYFTFSSSDEAVATVGTDGSLQVVGAGTASITATLGSVAATGVITLQSFAGPADPATPPTLPGAEVLSLFSNVYTNHTVDSWSADWDMADLADVQIDGDDVKLYTNVSYAGIEFASAPVDASAYTHLHLDVYSLEPSLFKVKLVDFGADGAYGGGDDSEAEISLTTTTNPAMQVGAWSSLDLPLAYFSGLDGTSHLTQLILSGASSTLYVDNLYFFTGEAPGGPPVPAPAPLPAAADVVALFSDAYDTVPVGTWSADWDLADVMDVEVQGDAVKRYSNLVYAGIEFTGPTVDATTLTHFHMDIWTPDPTSLPATFKIKLVDFGADGAYQGGDDVEHELTFDAASTPALVTGNWIRFDLPLADFTGLTSRGHLAQLILSGQLGTLFVDNVLFHR